MNWDIGAGAVVLRSDRVLLVRQTYGARLWGIPGGHALPDETLDQAALRELREETGLAGQVLDLVLVRTRSAEAGRDPGVYVAFRVDCPGEPIPDGQEIDAVQFFAGPEIAVLPGVIELSRQVALAALAAPRPALVEREIPGRSDAGYRAYVAGG